MSPSEIEKNNLETHVELCHQRQLILESKLSILDDKVEKLGNTINDANKSTTKVIIGAAATIIGGLLSTIIVVIIAFL